MNEVSEVTRPVVGYPIVIDRIVELLSDRAGVETVERTSPNGAIIKYRSGANWRQIESSVSDQVSSEFWEWKGGDE